MQSNVGEFFLIWAWPKYILFFIKHEGYPSGRKTMIELEQTNHELQILRGREQQVKADAKLEGTFEK